MADHIAEDRELAGAPRRALLDLDGEVGAPVGPALEGDVDLRVRPARLGERGGGAVVEGAEVLDVEDDVFQVRAEALPGDPQVRAPDPAQPHPPQAVRRTHPVNHAHRRALPRITAEPGLDVGLDGGEGARPVQQRDVLAHIPEVEGLALAHP
ncbi:MAG: hypothetical protein ACK559_05940, partial [bacterium]